jgi:FG-GAP-like repeat
MTRAGLLQSSCVLLVTFGLTIPLTSVAGMNPTVRKNCKIFAKYRLEAEITHTVGNKHCRRVDTGCGYAEVEVPCFYPYAYGSGQIGSGAAPWTLTSVDGTYSGGRAFISPANLGPESVGVARGAITPVVDFADGPNNTTIVTIHDFTGSISAKSNSLFGDAFRCVVWKGSTIADSALTPTNILWDGGVRIEDGGAFALGTFSLSDFVITTTTDDSTGFPVILVTPIEGLTKTIIVNDADLDNSVAVSMFDDVGYGVYDPNGIFSDSHAYSSMLTIDATGGSGTYAGKMDFPTGSAPSAVTIGDLNGDGKPDLVAANQFGSSVSVLLGNGDGTFGAKQDFATGAGPYSVALGDLNGDGALDLAAAIFGDSAVSVLIGDGLGGFGPKTDYPAGEGARVVAIADFNGDANLDLVTANQLDTTVTVLLGDGTGGFGPKTDFRAGDTPVSVSSADLNGDGIPDLVETNYYVGTVSVLLGNGDGTFGPKTDFAAGAGADAVAIGDLNGDGKLDLVVENQTNSSISVLLGNGSGGFGPRTDFQTGGSPYTLALRDLNGDGKLDVATANVGSNTVSILIGDGAGGFAPRNDFATGVTPVGVAAADMNGDGVPDLAVASQPSNTVGVLLGLGGSILPAGTTSLDIGANQTYTITPAAGFIIVDVWVDGVSQGPITSYSFTNVTTNHKISVKFARGALGVNADGPVAFALEGVRPNPSTGRELSVAFALPNASAAYLELVDVSGRMMSKREVGALGAGRHIVQMNNPRGIEPGLYWVRLVQGTNHRAARVAVVQ